MKTTNNIASVFSKFAKVYENKFMDYNVFNDTYDFFLKLLPNDKTTVLDIGCGPGNITKYLLQKRQELNVLGIDIAEEMLQLAKKNNPTANFKPLDCKHIGEINMRFDGLICGFCLPYLSKEDVNSFIRDSYKLLNNNGILYISTMEGAYDSSRFIGSSSGGKERIFTYYYTEEYLKNVLLKNGYTILETTRKKQEVENNETEAVDIVFIAQKQYYEYTN